MKNPNQANPKSNRTRPEYRSHTGPPAQTEKPVCTASPLCEGCPFPGHGFLCQGEDGECMRTRLMKLSEKEEPKELTEKNIRNQILVPTRKDWNEDLLFLRKEDKK